MIEHLAVVSDWNCPPHQVVFLQAITRRVKAQQFNYRTDFGKRQLSITIEPADRGAKSGGGQNSEPIQKEAIDLLAGGLGHDLGNLLVVVSESLTAARKRLGQGNLDGATLCIDTAQGATRRAASIANRLLAFARRQTLAPMPTGLNPLIFEMEGAIRQAVGPEIRVEVIGARDLWLAHVDKIQIGEVLFELCANARQAMPTGGEITIETANGSLDDSHASDLHLSPGDYVIVRVVDRGVGMAPEVKARAIDPFFTTDLSGQRNGLGLSMAHGFARQSGGQLQIYSRSGAGTMICLYLPRHPEGFGAPCPEARW